jgi:hypothetical protein
MKPTFALCLLLSLSACGAIPAETASSVAALRSASLTGRWTGTVDAGFATGTFTLDVTEQSNGVLKGMGHIESALGNLVGRLDGLHDASRVTGTLTSGDGQTAMVDGNLDDSGNTVRGRFAASGLEGTFVANRM